MTAQVEKLSAATVGAQLAKVVAAHKRIRVQAHERATHHYTQPATPAPAAK